MAFTSLKFKCRKVALKRTKNIIAGVLDVDKDSRNHPEVKAGETDTL
jgi:hypothetical protein